VLSTDERVSKEARLLLGQDEDPAGTVGEALERELQHGTDCGWCSLGVGIREVGVALAPSSRHSKKRRQDAD